MTADKHSMLGLAEKLVTYGTKKGASGVEVSITEGSEFRASVRDGELETLTEAGSKGLGLRVFVGDKVANASSSDFAESTLTKLLDNAITRAKLGGKDPFAGLPKREKAKAKAEDLEIFDPAILELAPEKKIGYAKQAESIGLKQEGVTKSLGSSFVTVDRTRTLVNSEGFKGSYRSTIGYATAYFQAGEGDNLFQDGWFGGGTTLAKLPEPEALATTAARRVTRLVGARKVETQNVPVVFEPRVTASLLLGLLAGCVDGESVSLKQSFLVDRLGEKIASDSVSIIDDGLRPGCFGTAPFDSEGVPCRKTTVIGSGKLESYLLDTYYARKLGLKSTGNADGTTNFYWAAGGAKPEEIIKSVDKGLLLTGTIGQGTNTTTGDISIGAFGLWIEDGEPAFPVAEVTVSSNLADLLNGVEMVGNDLRFLDDTNGPTVKVAEMTVGGTSAQS
jgi:PmbA protein